MLAKVPGSAQSFLAPIYSLLPQLVIVEVTPLEPSEEVSKLILPSLGFGRVKIKSRVGGRVRLIHSGIIPIASQMVYIKPMIRAPTMVGKV